MIDKERKKTKEQRTKMHKTTNRSNCVLLTHRYENYIDQ